MIRIPFVILELSQSQNLASAFKDFKHARQLASGLLTAQLLLLLLQRKLQLILTTKVIIQASQLELTR